MRQSPFITGWGRVFLGTLLLTLATLGASAVNPKRVLILDPFGREAAPFSTVVSTFRTTLARKLGEPLDLYEVPLELARFADSEGEGPLAAFLEGRIKSQPVDLVVPIGGAGVQFVARHRERLFAAAPVLIVGAEPRMLPPGFLQTNVTLVTQRINLPGMVEDILQLQPQTTNIVVVFGASALEKFWVGECRREFQSFTNRVGFTWLNELSLAQILKRCAALPPRSFILHGLFLVDVAGVPCEQNEALRRLHEVANAPLYGMFASEFGLGPIGGRLFQDSEIGAQGARTAIRILRGERPENIPPQLFEAAAPVYDWRELRRWGVNEARLPAGSVIEFRQPGFWERYRWPITGTVLVCLLQAVLITGLLVNRGKRRQGEAEATLIADISSKFVNLPANEVDREIMDAERRICELLGLDLSALWQWSDGTPGFFTVTHYYSAQAGPQPSRQLQEEDFPWFRQQMLANRIVAISSLREMPTAAAHDREVCRQLGIKSNLCLPLSVGGEPPFGILGLNTTRAERDWPDVLVKRLQLVAQIFTNALARKRADQALRENEERMTMAAEAAKVGLWKRDLVRNEIWVTDTWRTMFGVVPSEALDFDKFLHRLHPEDRENVRQAVAKAVAGDGRYETDFRVVLPDGRVRWTTSRGQVEFDEQGQPVSLRGVTVDITERRLAEEKVRQLSLAVEQSPVSVVITDLEGSMIYVNRKFSEVSGYSFAECIGQNPRLLKSGECPPATYQELWAHITRGDTWRGEFHNRKKNGELYWEWAVISPLLDADGKVTYFVGVKEDITGRKQAALETKELQGRLAHAGRVTLLGQLSSALAHELSQPLGAILRNAEAAEIMLQAAVPDLEELRAIVTDILRDDQRASQVIDRLRSLLKRRNLGRQPVELPGLITEVLSLLHGDAAARQVKLACSAAPGLPLVWGDRIHLQQVLLNLIVNSMDALADGNSRERTVRVSARRTDAATVEVRVSDNGPGIPGESLKRLFVPFFTTKSDGMGLGLSVSKTIIEAHQGSLWAENRSDGGACFCFTLQVASDEGRVAGDK